jgi:hypothetical protein
MVKTALHSGFLWLTKLLHWSLLPRIKAFAPMQDTLEVNGDNADPLYKYLKQQQPRAVPGSRYALNAEIGWNYEKVESALMASWFAPCCVCSSKTL